MKYKLDAIAQLPVEMQESAWVPDESPYPEYTWWPTWTVPQDFPITSTLIQEGKVEKKKKKLDVSYGVAKSSKIIK